MPEEKECLRATVTIKKKMRLQLMLLIGWVLSVHEGVFREFTNWLIADIENNIGKYFKYRVE